MKYCIGFLTLATAGCLMAASEASAQKHITASAEVLSDIMASKDKGIPTDLMAKADCVAVVPNLKRAGFVVGAKFGKGIVTCRTANGWSAPSIIRIEGGSIGLQIGAGETDVVMLVMNQRGMDKLMSDKFTVGGDASVMAGPVGRTAEANTDATMRAEILAYSRAKGVFAGIALQGATLRPDNADNRELYAREITQREILTGGVKPPVIAGPLYAQLNRYAPARHSATR